MQKRVDGVFFKKKKSFVTRSRAKTYLSDDTNGVSLKKWIGKCIPISICVLQKK